MKVKEGQIGQIVIRWQTCRQMEQFVLNSLFADLKVYTCTNDFWWWVAPRSDLSINHLKQMGLQFWGENIRSFVHRCRCHVVNHSNFDSCYTECQVSMFVFDWHHYFQPLTSPFRTALLQQCTADCQYFCFKATQSSWESFTKRHIPPKCHCFVEI